MNSEDNPPFFLQTVFKYLPADGQFNLIEDLSGYKNDQELRQHVGNLDTGLLRPMLSTGGKTPEIAPSPRLRLEESMLGDINREDNILMMASVFHEDFGKFHFTLSQRQFKTDID